MYKLIKEAIDDFIDGSLLLPCVARHDIAGFCSFGGQILVIIKNTEPTNTTTDALKIASIQNDYYMINNILRNDKNIYNAVAMADNMNKCDIITGVLRGSSVFCTGGIPIINDIHKYTTTDPVRFKYTFDHIYNSVYRIAYDLETYRYTAIEINDINVSNVSMVVDTIKELIHKLQNEYAHSFCMGSRGDIENIIIDRIILSIYNIKDMIPIFDPSAVDGIVMEIFSTNSSITKERIANLKENSGITNKYFKSIKLLFSKHTTNITNVDGDKIEWGRTLRSFTNHSLESIGMVNDFFRIISNNTLNNVKRTEKGIMLRFNKNTNEFKAFGG